MSQPAEVATSERDYWSLYDPDYGREIPCDSARRFLSFLLSPGTRQARLVFHNPVDKTVKFILYGIRCEDGEFLNMSYVLTATEVHEALKLEEKRRLVNHLLELWGPPYSPAHPLRVVFAALNLN